MIVPIPLHPSRMRKRGFNQSLYFANGLAESLGKTVIHDKIVRIKGTETQTAKGRYDRLQNMLGAFECIDSSPFDGKNILLVDDVLTTGATIEACLNSLQNAVDTTFSFVTMAIAE